MVVSVDRVGVSTWVHCLPSTEVSTLFWLMLYGGIVILSLLPEPYPTPDRMLGKLHFILRGEYDPAVLVQVAGITLTLSVVAAAVGLLGFSRKDV